MMINECCNWLSALRTMGYYRRHWLIQEERQHGYSGCSALTIPVCRSVSTPSTTTDCNLYSRVVHRNSKTKEPSYHNALIMLEFQNWSWYWPRCRTRSWQSMQLQSMTILLQLQSKLSTLCNWWLWSLTAFPFEKVSRGVLEIDWKLNPMGIALSTNLAFAAFLGIPFTRSLASREHWKTVIWISIYSSSNIWRHATAWRSCIQSGRLCSTAWRSWQCSTTGRSRLCSTAGRSRLCSITRSTRVCCEALLCFASPLLCTTSIAMSLHDELIQ